MEVEILHVRACEWIKLFSCVSKVWLFAVISVLQWICVYLYIQLYLLAPKNVCWKLICFWQYFFVEHSNIRLLFVLYLGMNKPGEVDPRYLISVSESLLIFLPRPIKKFLSSIGPQYMKPEYKVCDLLTLFSVQTRFRVGEMLWKRSYVDEMSCRRNVMWTKSHVEEISYLRSKILGMKPRRSRSYWWQHGYQWSFVVYLFKGEHFQDQKMMEQLLGLRYQRWQRF